jgi:hypothetical protein
MAIRGGMIASSGHEGKEARNEYYARLEEG